MMVWLVGAGPGDPGLLTLRGRELLAEADVVVYDALASGDLLGWARPGAELLYVGKVAGNHALSQGEINELLIARARSGGPGGGPARVVRLKGGDPYIFGRGGEEGEALAAAGVPFEVVPGVSSAVAAPAYAGIPLTHRGLASSVSIITGHECAGKGSSAINWQALAASGSTLVFVMGMQNLEEICGRLIQAGLSADTPAALIYRGTMPEQRSLICPLGDLAREGAARGFSNPAVIVVGQVCSLAPVLDWFGSRPLLGRTVLVTRARRQASGMAAMLSGLGARVLQFPTIAIRPAADYSRLDQAIQRLGEYAWLIFTSVNGVEHFWQRLTLAALDSRALAGVKVAAIGPATASALAARGISADFVPEKYVAESTAAGLLARVGGDMRGLRVLLPRAARARELLPQELAQAGALVDVAAAYETVPAAQGREEVLASLAKGEISCIAFASSSTVENFLASVPPSALGGPRSPVLAAIGPITADALAARGLRAQIMPQDYTIPALVEAIAGHFRRGSDGVEGGNDA